MPQKIPTDWLEQAYLKAANGEAADAFGSSVTVSGDTVVVGVISEASNQTTITNGPTASADNSAADAGAAYVFVRSGTTWSQQAYIKAPNAELGDYFGQAVALDGDTLVVTALYEDSGQATVTNGTTASSDNSAGDSGAAYVFVRSGTTWGQQAYLKAANVDSGDSFGISAAISGDTIVIGARDESSNQTTVTNGTGASSDNSLASTGAAYVFVRSGVNWAQQAYLKAPNAETIDNFGSSVSVHADTIVVGAGGEDSNQTTITNAATASADNSAAGAGAAYVFVRSGTVWSQQAYLKASNAGSADQFGISVAVHGDTIAVGASDEDSNQTTVTNGATASADNSLNGAGAVYVFVRSGTIWSQQAYLKAANAGASDQFGASVALSGDTLVVGALTEDSNQTTITNGATASANNSAGSAGAAYVFVRTSGLWSAQAYLKASNAGANDLFGYAIAVSGDTIVSGAFQESSNQTTVTNGGVASGDNSATNAGAAYVFFRQ